MRLDPAVPAPRYPNVGQALLLALAAVVVQVSAGGIAYILICLVRQSADTPMSAVFNPWVLLPIVFFTNAMAIGLGRQGTKESVRTFLTPHPFTPQLAPIAALTGLGLALVLSETDNWILHWVSLVAGPDKLVPDIIPMAEAPIGALLLVVIAAPVLEEYLFRGMILRGLLQNVRVLPAVLTSALLFGVVHGNLRQFILAVVIGTVFGWWYARTRSVVPGMIGHATFNAVAWVTAMLPGWFEDLGFSHSHRTVVHEPWWLFTAGLGLTALGLWMFHRRASDIAPGLSWSPAPRGAGEPPLLYAPPPLEPPPLLEVPPLLEPPQISPNAD